MTGYESKKAMAQAKLDSMEREALKLALDLATMHHTDDGYAELRSKVRQFAKEALAQPAQEPMKFAGIQMRVGDKQVQVFLTQMEFHRAEDPWALMAHKAAMCISKLKEMNNGT